MSFKHVKVRKHVLLRKLWGLFFFKDFESHASVSSMDQDEGRPERREEGGTFFFVSFEKVDLILAKKT